VQQLVELGLARRLVIAARIEVTHNRPQVFRESLRIQDARKPAQADQPVDGRREVDPAEWHVGGKVDAPCLDRRQLAPQGVARRGRVEIGIYRDDDIGIPAQYLLDRHLHQPAPPQFGGDIDGTELLDALDVDRAGETRVQPLLAAAVVNPRTLARRYLLDPTCDNR